MRSRTAGFTFIEMLIAGTILVMMLGSLGSLFVSTTRASETNRRVTEAAGQLRSAVQALQYDIGLAGFCGLQAACSMTEPLSVTVNDDGASRHIVSLSSRFRETRFTGGGETEQLVAYSLVGDRLMRSVNGDQAVAIAEGITGFKLLGYRSRADSEPQIRYLRPGSQDLSGVDIRIDYRQGGEQRWEAFTVLLQNPQ